MKSSLIFIIVLGIAFTSYARRNSVPLRTPPEAKQPDTSLIAQAEVLVLAKVTEVGESKRRMMEHTYTDIGVEIKEVYRGNVEKKNLTLSIGGWMGSERDRADQLTAAKEAGEDVVLVLSKALNHIGLIYPGKPEIIKLATAVGKLPIGWNVEDDKITSVWSAVPGKFSGKEKHDNVCSKTGRPAFVTDPKLELAAKITDKKMKKDDNSYTVTFHITLTNPTDKTITVDSLRSSGVNILWDESLLFINEQNVWLPLGYAGFTKDTTSTVIEPGQELSTDIKFTAQFGGLTKICIGDMSVNVSDNMGRNMDLYIQNKWHPKPPFQKKTTEEEKKE